MGTDDSLPRRVLLVPDVPYWICATIARAYAQHNPEIEFEICSGRVLRTLPRLNQYIDNFDLVHFLTPQDANKSIGDFAGQIATVTTIHHVQDDASTQSVAESDAVMTASTQWMDRLEDAGVPEAKLVQVPYGVDTSVFSPPEPEQRRAQRAALGIENDAFVVGFVGKKSSDVGGRKGTQVFVRGVRQMAEHHDNVAVLLVGPGWETVVAAFGDHGIPCVHKPFVVEEEEFARLYHAMDVYWCTSTIEGGPIPVLEAMASGVCCVATAVGMVPDVMVPETHGLIVPCSDEDAFAAHTVPLAEDGPRRCALGAAAATRIAHHFDWEQSARQVVPLYRRAMENFRARRGKRIAIPTAKAWPREWVAREERALSRRFHREAESPPSTLRRALRPLLENRWVRAMMRPAVPSERKTS